MIVACLKWALVDHVDERFAGVSPADRAALETALVLGERFGIEVLALSVGPAGADRVLRDALACGAHHVLRLDAPADLDSRDVGAALADAAGAAQVIVCGDHSLDRGSGTVPAYIAHHRHAAQALGLVSIDLDTSSIDALRAVRRLDGGRRELVTVPLPCVVSVESSVASLRRAPLRRALVADGATVDARSPSIVERPAAPSVVTPFRPRARVLPAPSGEDALERIKQLTDAAATSAHGDTIELPPREAAERIAATLRQWGHLP